MTSPHMPVVARKSAKYILAVNDKAAMAEIRNFADIAKFRDELDGKIYGIEPGNDDNRLIIDMITSNAFGLNGFEVVIRTGHATPKQRGDDCISGLSATPDEPSPDLSGS